LTVDIGILAIYLQIFDGQVGHLLLVASLQFQDGFEKMQTSELSIRPVGGGGRTTDGGMSSSYWRMVNFMKHWWTKELQW